MRANARAHADCGLPVAAVLKADGYGWGAARMSALLDDIVESYFVTDVDEFRALRAHTALPIRLLGDVPDSALSEVLRAGGVPNVSTLAALESVLAARDSVPAASIRLGTIRAAGWSTPAPEAWPALARALAGTDVRVELWTHVVAPEQSPAFERELFVRKATLEAHGVKIASIDAASTNGMRFEAATARVRVGAGLFGARLGATIPTRCAIAFSAPVVGPESPGGIPRSP